MEGKWKSILNYLKYVILFEQIDFQNVIDYRSCKLEIVESVGVYNLDLEIYIFKLKMFTNLDVNSVRAR